MDRFDDLPFLRFDPNAQAVFNTWQEDLQRLLRTGDLLSAILQNMGSLPLPWLS
jgi:hypothetical protein